MSDSTPTAELRDQLLEDFPSVPVERVDALVVTGWARTSAAADLPLRLAVTERYVRLALREEEL